MGDRTTKILLASIALKWQGASTRHVTRSCTRRRPSITYCSCPVKFRSFLMRANSIALKPFDAVVQRRTHHFWVNTGREPLLMCAMVGDR